jgi:hypothetical protein
MIGVDEERRLGVSVLVVCNAVVRDGMQSAPVEKPVEHFREDGAFQVTTLRV